MKTHKLESKIKLLNDLHESLHHVMNSRVLSKEQKIHHIHEYKRVFIETCLDYNRDIQEFIADMIAEKEL